MPQKTSLKLLFLIWKREEAYGYLIPLLHGQYFTAQSGKIKWKADPVYMNGKDKYEIRRL